VRRHAIVLAALVVAVALAPGASAAPVYVATVDGGINPAVSDYLAKAIDRAEREGAAALVIELDTPGGLLAATKDIVNEILNAEVAVIVYVSPRGAWAASAGTFITLAGHVAAMAPGTSIGAAHPVSIMPGATPPPAPGSAEEEEDGEAAPAVRDIMGEKIENFTAAFIESIAEARDRNVEWAVEAVRSSKAITQKEALEKNVIDVVADDLEHLLEVIDGREVKVGRDPVTLETAASRIVRVEMSAMNRFFDVISDPQIALLLILAGLLGLYVEFTQPGMIAPGIAGVISLVLAGLALQIIPFNWIGLMLILAGIGLLTAELFVTSFGVLFAAGILCFAVGGYMIFDVPEQSDLAVPFWEVVVPVVTALAVFGGAVVFLLSRSLWRPQVAGAEGLVGASATVYEDIDPLGKIYLHGDTWNARADRPIAKGERVRIVEVEDLSVRVEPDPGEKRA
jgi:membrane-bound serine protease (ClpP class)